VEDAIRHHNWATMRVLDACADLTDEQLHKPFPAMYGSVQETLRHVVDSDGWYLFRLADTEGEYDGPDDDADLGAIRVAAVANGREWERQLAEGWDPDRALTTPTIDGPVEHTFVGIWLAQAMHHGTDHRSQICTALTTFGMEPPGIDVWAYGESVGRLTLEPPDAER
jgi:uncharacterized damage-inducible protein DinB